MLRKIFGIKCEGKINQLNNHKWVSRFNIKYFCKNTTNNVKEPNILHVNESENQNTESTPSIDRTNEVSDLLENAANFNEITDTAWSTMPYPENTVLLNNKEKKPITDPEDTTVLLFPGQGTLRVGAVKKYLKYPRVNELFNIGNDILGYNILDICLNGPQDKLNRTEFNQVATVMTSLAALEKIWDQNPQAIESCKAVAGYSIGELTALVFSGSLTIEDGIRLAGIRGAAMQYASDLEPQGMLTVMSKKETKSIGLICAEANNWTKNMGISEPVCRVSIYLYTNTKVIAGHNPALEYIENNFNKYDIEKTVKLPVSGAFHTELMKPALKSFNKALNDIEIEKPRVNVYSNITAIPYRSAIEIRKSLPKQIVKAVRWEQILHDIYKRPQGSNFPETFDLGSNGTMKVVLSRVNLKAAKLCKTV